MNYSDYEREVAAKGDLTKAVMSEFKAFKDEYWSEVKGIRSDLDGVMTALRRPAFGAPGEHGGKAVSLETKAFLGWVRGGESKLEPHELKALNRSDDPAGGYLAPSDFRREMDRNLVLFSPVRSVARVDQTASGNVLLPKRTANLTAAWVGELEQRPESQPVFGETEIVVHEAAVGVPVSNQLLDDSAIDINAELGFAFAEEFGRLESLAFVAGNGVKKPAGLLSANIAKVKTGAAAGFHATAPGDALIDLYHALPSYFAAGAVWAMNRTTMGAVRKMKAGGDGAYLWHEPIAEGNPPTILGRPVVEFSDLPDVAAGSLPVIFGNFRLGYRIFDRVGMSVLRDPYTKASVGQTVFHARRRVGGAVTKPEAFRALVVSA